MAQLIQRPTRIQAAGNKPKLIDEFVGLVNSNTSQVSMARMQSPPGWQEPGQTPEFDEYTVVLRGLLRVETRTGVIDVAAGQGIMTAKGEWIRSAPRGLMGRTISRFVCRPFPQPRCTEIRPDVSGGGLRKAGAVIASYRSGWPG